MTTEELSLIVAALAVVVGPVVAYKLGVRRFAHERELDDRADARSILADGALKGVMKDVLTTFTRPLETGEDWPDEYGEEISKLEQAAEDLEAALAAVRIRFDQGSDVVVELDAALAAARSVITVYFLARSDDLAGGNRRERQDRKSREDYSEVMQLSLNFDNHKAAYLAAAQKVVGVNLAAADGPGRIEAS
jgi:hypothetical protein